MTPLASKLADRIRAEGPMTVAEYMAACLGDPEHGYYMRSEPFGRAGDFITAPEVSQMFGELVGLWAVAAWELMDEPSSFALVELGPGRGTLMADMVRTGLIKPDFLRAASFHLVENSPRLREVQRQTLAPTGLTFTWHEALEAIPPGPAIFIANEFFDAMPIRQFQWRDGRWSERMVGLDEDERFAFGLAPVEHQPADAPALPEETIVEASPTGNAIMTRMAMRLAAGGGAALVIDYGSATPGVGSTLQAVRDHKYDDPFGSPGEADVTAHVDFSALTRTAAEAGADPRTVMGQGEFLVRMGLVERAKVLGRGKEQPVRDAIATAMERLASPKAMGELFKVLALSAPGQTLPVFDVDRSPPPQHPATPETADDGEDAPAEPAPAAKKKRTRQAAKPKSGSKSKPKAKSGSKAKSSPKPTPGHEKGGPTRH